MNSLNPVKEQWIFGEKWERASVEEQDGQKGIFILILRRSGKSARLLVTPALEGKDFDEAMATYRRIKKEQKAMKKRQQESYARQSEFNRSFSINLMGIYTYDRILKMLPGNRIAVFDQEDFKRAQPWNFDSFEFKFKDSGKKISSPEDLRTFLQV